MDEIITVLGRPMPTRPANTPPPPHTVSAAGAAAAASPRAAAIAKSAQDFEAMFLGQMFEQVYATVGVDPNFGGGTGEEIFRGMMVQEFGRLMAARGGVGIAEQVQKELLRAQEARP